MSAQHFKAVVFDIGGVVCKSPLIAIAAYEKEHGLPENYINCAIAARGKHGAWQKFERGEMALKIFYEAFGRELSDTEVNNAGYKEYCARKAIECPPLLQTVRVDGRELFGRMMRTSQTWDDLIVEAMCRIREDKRFRVIALTNNYGSAGADADEAELAHLGWQDGAVPDALHALFDDFCDSSTLGMRKPEPEFYLTACRRNGIEPREAIFLDDLGINLKAARALGMKTIHVPIGGSLATLKELESIIGINLTSPRGAPKL